jgi:peptidoglycan/LPS O-acetylase OafA/YrhL
MLQSTPDTAPAKLPSLTGLRFVAAIIVFVSHTSMSYSPVPPYGPVNPFNDSGLAHAYEFILANGGYVGVSFFFVLSGFVLTWSARPGERARPFLRRRLLKIFPNHVVTWAIAMILFAGAVTPVSQWLPNLLLLHSFSPEPYAWVSVNPQTWSLSSELLFYLTFPLLIVLVRRISERRLWAWAGAMIAGMIAVVLANQYLVVLLPNTANPDLETPVTGPQFWLGYFFPPVRLFEFALGMLLARIVLSGRCPRIGVLPASVLVIGAYAASLFLPYVYIFNLATVIPIAALVCAAAMADLRGTPTILRSRPMQWLGEVSYAFYMCQGIVLLYGSSLLGGQKYSTPVAIAVMLGFFAANLFAAWLLHTCVERPVMRRWGRSRKGVPVRGAPAPSAPGP